MRSWVPLAVIAPLLPCCGGGAAGNGGSTDAGPAVAVVVAVPASVLGDLEVDSARAYFTEATGAHPGRIASVPLVGGSISVLASVDDSVDAGVETIKTGVSLALDASNVYFLAGSQVGRVPKAGGAVAVLASDRPGWSAAGLALGGEELDWMQFPLQMPSADLDQTNAGGGGAVATVATGLSPAARSTADATSYYWAASDGSIDRIPRSGGPVTILARTSNGQPAAGIAVDAQSVYWTESSGCSARIGAPPCPSPPPRASIRRVPVDGGASALLATDSDAAGIAVDGAEVYWIDPYASIKWMAVGSGATSVQTLVANEPAYLGPVVAPDGVYWVAIDGMGTSTIKRAGRPR
jgi:hypothetical protein